MEFPKPWLEHCTSVAPAFYWRAIQTITIPAAARAPFVHLTHMQPPAGQSAQKLNRQHPAPLHTLCRIGQQPHGGMLFAIAFCPVRQRSTVWRICNWASASFATQLGCRLLPHCETRGFGFALYECPDIPGSCLRRWAAAAAMSKGHGAGAVRHRLAPAAGPRGSAMLRLFPSGHAR